MAIKISLSPGGDSDGSLLIPNVKKISDFAKGDFGISDNIKLGSTHDKIKKADLDVEAMGIFLKASGVEPVDELDSYVNNVGEIDIPKGDLIIKESKGGLKSLEKSIFKTVFETQKPYMDTALLFLESMVGIEDVISRLSGTLSPDGLSLRPNKNDNSLYTKFNGSKDDINRVKNLSKDTKNPFSDIDTYEKKRGVDVRNYKIKEDFNYGWEVVSIKYSTGVKIEGVNYEPIYKYLTNENLNLDSTPETPPKKYGKDKVKEDELPPTMIFGHYAHDGDIDDISHPKWSWLRESPKWYGAWEQLREGDKDKYDTYIHNYVKDRINKKGTSSNVDDSVEFIESKVDSKEVIRSGNENCFMVKINDINPKTSLGIGNDSPLEVSSVTKGKRKMFLPREVMYKGKKVYVDPEADYDLQIIKLTPTRNVYFDEDKDKGNNQLQRTTPLVGNYQGVNVDESSLDKAEYEIDSKYTSYSNATPKRVHTIKKYLMDATTTTDIKKYDKNPTYIIEGIRREKKNEDAESNDDNTDDGKYYKRVHAFTALPKFIDSIIDIATDMLPQIKGISKLLNKPHEFIFDIALDKIGDNFELMSSDIISKFSEAKNISNVYDRVSFVQKDELLKRSVSIDETTGDMKVLLDSVTMMDLLGVDFGVQFSEFIPKFILNKNNGNSNDSTGVNMNMIIKSLFDIVSMPIKVVKEMIDKVIDLFNNISFKTLTKEIPEFLTFKWVIDLIKPEKIMELMGIKIDPKLLLEWLNGDNVDKVNEFNMDDVMSIPFIQDFPTVNFEELEIIGKKPLTLLTQVFKLIEEVIKSIIEFIMSILGLDKAIDRPDYNLTKMATNANDNTGVYINKGEGFLYNISFPNGDEVKGLSENELNLYIKNNDGFNYQYSFK